MYLNNENMNFFEQRFQEDDFDSYLEELLRYNMIDGDAATGITKKVLSDGYATLSESQKKTFILYAIEPNYISECERCGINIPWCEMVNAVQEDSLCSYCSHMVNKDD